MSLYDDLVRENAALRKSQAANEAELRRADETIGALRKRVEQLEQTSFDLCPNCGWRTAGPDGCFKERAEKAERERDAQAQYIAGCDAAMESLQADLDAALDWIEKVEPVATFPEDRKILALLEKRREKRG